MSTPRPARTLRWPAAALLLLALLLRAGIPDGYMPRVDGRGSPVIEPCSGMAMPAPRGRSHDRDGQAPSGTATCPFSMLAAPALPAPPPVIPTRALAYSPAAASPERPSFTVPGAAAPPPPSTGPPATR